MAARWALLGVCLAIATCASPERDGRCGIVLEVVEEGRPTPALVRVTEADGRRVPLEGLLDRGLGLDETHPARGWSVLRGTARLRLPRAPLTIEAFRGIETETSRVEADLTGKESERIRLDLRRFQDVGGWKSANTHLHLQKISREEAGRYLTEVPAADGLDVLFVSHLERAEADREYVSNGLTEADLRELSGRSGVVFGNGEEHRHNFGAFGQGYGHAMLLNIRRLVQPVSLGPGIMRTGTDGIPIQRGIDEARRDGATILWCHNTFGLEDIPNWVAGRPHAQNIFDGDPAEHGSYSDTFYRYLNAGLRVPFSTGTDWFIYDFSRVYARVPSLKEPRQWLDALEKGRTFITNGPLLELTADGLGPGDTIRLAGPGSVRLRARAAGRVDFRSLELVRDGEVATAVPSRAEGGHFVAELSTALEVGASGWLAVRTPPPPGKDRPSDGFPRSELGGLLFSHSSPIYAEVAGRPVFQRQAAEGLLEEVKAARDEVEKTAVFADAHERGHVLAVYTAAIAILEKKLR